MLFQFIPHGHCYLWKSNLVGLHLISDLLIALSYYSIPITIIYFVYNRKDVPFASIFLLFGAFIVSCGTSHLMEIWTLWHPNYWISGVIKAITALISLYTAVEMLSVVPLALNLPSQSQLSLANKKLEAEIKERQQAEKALTESESVLRSFYDSVPMMMGIAECDDHQNLTHISHNYAATTLLIPAIETKGETQVQDSQLAISPENHCRLTSAFLQSEITLKPVHFEFTEFAKNARQNHQHFSATVSKIVEKHSAKSSRFSYLIEDISDRKRLEIVLQKSELRFRLAFEDAANGMAIVSTEGNFLKVNHSLCEILGFNEQELMSFTFQKITHAEDLKTDLKYLDRLLEGQINSCQFEKRYIHKLGHVVWVVLSVSLVRNFQNKPQNFIVQIQNVSDRKKAETQIAKSLEEKEVMLQEIHHRVKNNLQVICSLLNLQSRCLKDEKIIKAFKETQNRVRSMALVHEQLYQSTDLSQIALVDYIKQLTNNLFRAYSITSQVKCITEIEEFYLDLDTAVPCGLIINEIVSNALKYAFDSQQKGKIVIKAFASQENVLVLSIEDDGKGFDSNLDLKKRKSLGLKLVTSLVQQLQGELQIESKIDLGTKFIFTFNRIRNNLDEN